MSCLATSLLDARGVEVGGGGWVGGWVWVFVGVWVGMAMSLAMWSVRGTCICNDANADVTSVCLVTHLLNFLTDPELSRHGQTVLADHLFVAFGLASASAFLFSLDSSRLPSLRQA